MSKKVRNVNPKNMKEVKYEDAPIVTKLLAAGTAACIADLVTFPLDTSKVRLQVQGEGPQKEGVTRYKNVMHTIVTIVREEGAKSLYKGLSAGLQRQMCFASIRLGLYENCKSFYQQLLGAEGQETAHILVRIAAGMTTGALAVAFAQPTDVVKIRSQASRGKERMYKSTIDAYKSIYKSGGFKELWQGTYPNIARSCIVNVAEIVCYDMVKEALIKSQLMKDNTICHFTTGFIAGFFTTVVASPVDVIKTRYMNSTNLYRSAMHCAVVTFKKEGPTAFYKGFVPSFYRLVSWNIVLWVSYEKLKFLVLNYMQKE